MKLGTSNCFDLDTFIHDKTKRYTMQVHVAIYHVKKKIRYRPLVMHIAHS